MTRRPHLPTHPAAQPTEPPCDRCTAMCCRYYALEIDAPEDAEDFDSIKWYLLHEKSWVWVDDGEWYLQVDEKCRFLGDDHRCTIYERRPQICRDYGLPENLDHPDDPLCDYFAQGEPHDLEFREPEEIDAFAAKVLAEKASARARRSEAAKKAWKARRRRAADA